MTTLTTWFTRIADIAVLLFAAVIFSGVILRCAIDTYLELRTLWQKKTSGKLEEEP